MNFKIINFLFFLFYINNTFAQVIQAPTDSGTILNQQQQLDKKFELPKSIPKEKINSPASEKKIMASNTRITVKEFKFTGETKVISQSSLQGLVNEFVGKSLNFDELNAVLDKINRNYIDKGYFLARAYLPEQEIKDGIVIILIREGKFDSREPFKIFPDNLRLSEERIKKYINTAIENGVYDQQALEKAILNINDNPKISSTILLEQGSDEGSTKVNLRVTEGNEYDILFSADNYGSKYTGQNRTLVTGYINDPLKYGDQIVIGKIRSLDGGYDYNRLNYIFPVGVSGLRLDAGINSFTYKVSGDEIIDAAGYSGNGKSFSLTAQYPLFRTKTFALYFNPSISKTYLVDDSIGDPISDKSIQNIVTGFKIENIDKILGGGFTQLQTNFTSGKLDLSKNQDSLETDQSSAVGGPRTNGNFKRYNLQALRIQSVSDTTLLNVNFNGQISNKNLDSSQKLSLGGISGVRAYPTGEASGDEGYIVNIDLKYKVPNEQIPLANLIPKLNLTLSTFYDYGFIRKNRIDSLTVPTDSFYSNPLADQVPNSYNLKGYGVGLVFANETNNINLKTSLALQNGNNPAKIANSGNNADGANRNYQFYLALEANF